MKTTNFFPIKLISCCILLAFIVGCTFTSTNTKNPVFNKNVATLESGLKDIIICDNFDVNGIETKTNDEISSSLEIKVVNGLNIPSNDEGRKILARSIGFYIKSSLKDKDGYDTYKVIFITKKGNDLVQTNILVDQEFKSEEL